MANFKPSTNTMGTGFSVTTGNFNNVHAANTHFQWWIHRTRDQRWAINMWGRGEETINGITRGLGNPSVSQDIKVKRWEDIDMQYMISYTAFGEGVNVAFIAKYLPDDRGLESVPEPEVLRSNQTVLFKGSDPSASTLPISCIFQEN